MKGKPVVKLIDRPLAEQSVAFWRARERTGAAGLVLLDKLMKNVAEHRDWNGLAMFLVGAKHAKQDGIVKRILFHVFGTKLAVKADSKHPTKMKFIMSWDGVFDLPASNSYSTIKAAIDGDKSWDDLTLFKSLAKPDPKPKTRDSARYTAEAKRLAKMLDKLAEDGLMVGDILGEADKLRQVRNTPPAAGVVQQKVVNGVQVFEPNF